ncbi:disease resistance protein [Striga asiatica]|uniref:Disease resistance protein n=1 Tax=Striga asiatica TaxID=4170 RepID=A0A5A7QAM9_STRAF|nr:disease resistance protein [Striga asiatica]
MLFETLINSLHTNLILLVQKVCISPPTEVHPRFEIFFPSTPSSCCLQRPLPPNLQSEMREFTVLDVSVATEFAVGVVVVGLFRVWELIEEWLVWVECVGAEEGGGIEVSGNKGCLDFSALCFICGCEEFGLANE